MNKKEYTKEYYYNLLTFAQKSYIYNSTKEFIILTIQFQMYKHTLGIICTDNPTRYNSTTPFKVFETDELRKLINK